MQRKKKRKKKYIDVFLHVTVNCLDVCLSILCVCVCVCAVLFAFRVDVSLHRCMRSQCVHTDACAVFHMNGDVIFVHATRCVAAGYIPQRTFPMHATVCCCVLLRVALSTATHWKRKSPETAKFNRNSKIMEFGRDISRSLDAAPTAWYKRGRFTGNTGYKLASLSQPVFSGTRTKLQICPPKDD